MQPSTPKQPAAKSPTSPTRTQKLAAALKRNMARRKAGNLPSAAHPYVANDARTTLTSAAKPHGSAHE